MSTLEEMASSALGALQGGVGNASAEMPAGTAGPAVGSPASHLHRLHGTAVQHRHLGVTHVQHPGGVAQASGAKPAHPHTHVARAVSAKAAHVHHARTRAPKQENLPVHHAQHHRTKVHLNSVPGLLSLDVGTIIAYAPPTSSAAGTASVQLQGSVSRIIANLPITQSFPTDLLVLGAQCLVALLDPTNPQDSLIVGIYNAAPARLWQGETATVVVAGAASSGTLAVTFPTAYTSAVHSVVATSHDTSWVAVVQSVTTTGFNLLVQGLAGAVGAANIVCGWAADGV